MVHSTSHPSLHTLKRLVLCSIALLAFVCTNSYGQYSFAASSGTFTPLSGGTVVSSIHTDDNISGILPLGFDFNYFGSTFSQFKASSNGFISFDLSNAGQENVNSISGSSSTFKIAPLWDDVGGQQGTASYQVSGVAPNRIFTFEWLNWLWRYTATNPSISFQVKLYESSNKIEFIYRQEAGALASPTASIGLVGNINSVYYSLNGTGASPAASTSVPTNNLTTRPATGQVYTFTPAAGSTPGTQASNLVVNSVDYSSLSFYWTAGNGQYRTVFMKKTSAVESPNPVDNVVYSSSSDFGSGAEISSSGWFSVYNGTGTSTTVSNLELGTTYRIAVLEYNGASPAYLTSFNEGNTANVTTLDVPAPTQQASLQVPVPEYDYVNLNFTAGDGTQRVVFAKQTSNANEMAPVVQGTVYSASSSFGYGTQIGSTGWFCVYDGAGTSTSVSNLSLGTAYQFHVLEYNSAPGGVANKYLLTDGTNNPSNVTTKNVVTPTNGAASVNVATSTNQMSISWVKGNGTDRVVFIKETTNTTETAPLSDNQTYYPSSHFGWGSYAGDWTCVFDSRYSGGNVNSVEVTSLRSNSEYQVQVIEYNQTPGQSYQRYLLAAAPGNPIHVTTSAGSPALPSSTIDPTYVSGSMIGVFGTENAGDYHAVFIKRADGANTGDVPVMNGQTYSGDNEFGSGTEVGNSGWFCVYNNDYLSSFDVDGLEPFTTYLMQVVDYNGTGSGTMYRPAGERFRTSVFTTTRGTQSLGYSLTSTSESFEPLTDGTRLQSIEQSSSYSDEIPVGFTFYYDGVPYTSLRATSGGSLTFNKYLPDPQNAAYWEYYSYSFYTNDLEGTLLRPMIAPVGYVAIGGTQNSKVTYTTTGDSPNRVFTIEFLNWRWNSYQPWANLSFQIRLHEADGKIQMIYRRENSDYYTPQGPIGLALHNRYSAFSLSDTGSNPTLLSYSNWVNGSPATGQVYSFTPVLLNQSITFNSLPDKVYGDQPFDLNATASSGLPVSYEIVSGPATLSGKRLTITGAGTVTVRARQGGDDFVFAAASDVDQSFYVDKATQTITFHSLDDLEYGEEHTLTATNSSGLAVSFSSDDIGIAQIDGNNTLTGVGIGTVRIIAYNNGDDNHYATDTEQYLDVVMAKQTISFDPIADKNLNDPNFALAATATSGLPVSYNVTGPATLIGNQIDITGTGTVEITASQVGDANYLAAENKVRTFEVTSKQGQSISFAELQNKTIDDASFQLTATATSNLAVAFSSSDNSVAEVSGSTVTIKKSGTVIIKATQPGNASYNAALPVERVLNVFKKTQTITFAELTSKKVSDAPFTLTATASSTLPVTFTSSNPSVASISGNTVTIHAPGSTTISVSQSGNDSFYAAAEVSRVLQVNDKSTQSIAFGALAGKKMGDPAFTLTATASSALSVSYTSSNTSVATVTGNSVTIVGVGSAIITASQAGNADYFPATSVQQTLFVTKASQTITFAELTEKIFGEASFSLTATSSSGLPVTFTSSDPTIASISGNTVELKGAGSVSITAAQGGNDTFEAATPVSRTLTVTVVTGDIIDSNYVSELYPNPAIDYVTIESRLVSGEHTLQTIDGAGRKFNLPTKKLSNTKLSVEVKDLTSGLYYLQLSNQTERVIYRLFKK